MKLVVISGPPAVGKMTVGQLLAEKTGFVLFHNHMSIELVNRFFDFGTDHFRRLDDAIRFAVFREISQSNLKGLVFTMVWDYDDPKDEKYIDKITDIFKTSDADIYFVELFADLDERLIRNRHPNRLKFKPSKRNVELSEKSLLQSEKNHRMNSNPFEFKDKEIYKIDNTSLHPEIVVEMIIDKYRL